MTPVEGQVAQWVGQAFLKAGFPAGSSDVVVSERPEIGDYQCNGAMAISKQVGLPPRQIAERVVREMKAPAACSVDGPGFINVRLHDSYLTEQAALLTADARLGVAAVAEPITVTIDFGGPNVAKPLHIGHLRTAVIGDCLQRLQRFMGNTVTSDVHMGDWGTQMGMVIEGIRRMMPGSVYFQAGYAGAYPEELPLSSAELAEIYPMESARCKSDPEAYRSALSATVRLQAGDPGLTALWRQFTDVSVAESRQLYDTLGIHFDAWNGESTYNDLIPPLLAQLREQGLAVMSEGALIIPLTDMPPLLLLKSDGAYLYATTDLATLYERVQSGQRRILYVVDQRQSLHFKQLFSAATATGILPPSVDAEFLGYGTVNGPDGKPYKTRSGNAPSLGELVRMVRERSSLRLDELRTKEHFTEQEKQAATEAITVASLKFADLINSRLTNYVFDVDRVTAFEGKTGPYVLYTAVRINSLLAGEVPGTFHPTLVVTAEERNVLLLLLQLSPHVHRAYQINAPHVLCEFAFALSQAFNRFYQTTPVRSAESAAVKENRLALTSLCAKELKLLCGLIGMDIPEHM